MSEKKRSTQRKKHYLVHEKDMHERTREQLTKATEFWQVKTNKNCGKEEKEIPDKSPRE